MKALKYIKDLKTFKINEFEDGFEIEKVDWINPMFFNDEDTVEHVKEQLEFLKGKFIKYFGYYTQSSVEVLIKSPKLYLDSASFTKTFDNNSNKPNFSIRPISKELHNYIKVYVEYKYDGLDLYDDSISLHIYNVEINNEEEAFNHAKMALFELSCNHDVILSFNEIPKINDDMNLYDDIHINLEAIKDNNFQISYDSDLVNYYCRADAMNLSEFKYLAFYQVLECIYDEVYSATSVNELKQIIGSSWFSKSKTEDMIKIISMLEKRTNSKNDKEKLNLVLNKFFKGSIHKESFLIINKQIYLILKDRMKLIKDEDDFYNMQKLVKIIYEFRCDCTHINRKFPNENKTQNDDETIENYIEFIKLISERVIKNYRSD